MYKILTRMTKDELNAWYHKYLGKCVHDGELIPVEGTDPQWSKCAKCGYAPIIPDYLSNPAVILGIITKERLRCEPCVFVGNGITEGWIINGVDYKNVPINCAVMLALKAKVENAHAGS